MSMRIHQKINFPLKFIIIQISKLTKLRNRWTYIKKLNKEKIIRLISKGR
jgi:hypothetical protein